MLFSTEVLLLSCIGQAASLTIRSLLKDTVSSLLSAHHNSSLTHPIPALNVSGAPPPELYIKTDNVRDLQNASLTKGLVKFSNYEYSEGSYPTQLIQQYLIKALESMVSEQRTDRQGVDETIEDNYFLYSQPDPKGGEIQFILQAVEAQLGTKRQTTWRDVTVVISALVSWVALWQRAYLLLPSTEIALEVYDGHGYVVVSSGLLFTIVDTSQKPAQDLQVW